MLNHLTMFEQIKMVLQ